MTLSVFAGTLAALFGASATIATLIIPADDSSLVHLTEADAEWLNRTEGTGLQKRGDYFQFSFTETTAARLPGDL